MKKILFLLSILYATQILSETYIIPIDKKHYNNYISLEKI